MTAPPALAAAGDLDTSFSGDGKVRTDFSSRGEIANSVAIQGDGKIVVAGASGIGGSNPKFAMARYEVDGSRDRSFSGDGKLVTDFTAGFDAANAVAIQANGKIVAAGESGDGGPNPTFALARYNGNGSLDTTFGGDGKVTTDFTTHGDLAHGVAIQADGKIVAAGTAGWDASNPKFALARYKANGSLDATFSGDGKVTTDFTLDGDFAFWGVIIQEDGKIVVAGVAGSGGSNPKFALARYDTDGSLDTSFSGDGKVATDFTPNGDPAFGLAIQADGQIVAAGEAGAGGSNPKFALARFDTDGSLDTSFSGDGKVATDFTPLEDGASLVAIQGDGKIVVAGVSGYGGSNSKFALTRYDTDGALDASFSGNGKLTTDFTSHADYANGLAIQGDGRILAAGESGEGGLNPKVALARYLAA